MKPFIKMIYSVDSLQGSNGKALWENYWHKWLEKVVKNRYKSSSQMDLSYQQQGALGTHLFLKDVSNHLPIGYASFSNIFH